MIEQILGYVRNLFSAALLPTRKRRLDTEEYDRPPKKCRRISNSQMSFQEDDWRSTSSSGSIRKHYGFQLNGSKYLAGNKSAEQKSKTTILSKGNPQVIIIDDDDEDFVKKSRAAFKQFSNKSPLFGSTRNDNMFIRNLTLEKRFETPKRSPTLFSHSYPTSLSNSKSLTNGNASTSSISPVYNTSTGSREDRSRVRNVPIMRKTYSSALDQSIRLDEKKQYQEMLNKSFLVSESFQDYSTPIGKIPPVLSKGSRGKRCVDLARTGAVPKTIGFIDLTKNKPKLTAKETIARVLNNFDSNDVVEIKDNESDIEILPDPPSPEPDFKVHRVNSLKTYIDLSESTQDDFISNLLKTHTDNISRRRQKIVEQETLKKQLCDINTEIRLKKLEEDVQKVLQIKEFLLPIEKPSEKLPALTPEQERKVAYCFDRRGSENEILVSKFNLNIARRDIMTLNGLNWLNDEVINFYMNLIIERAKDSKWPKAHAMNTFFYHKISKDGYGSVRRWTKKVDIFSYDLLVVPIHLSMHWCMALVDFRAKTIGYYDSMGSSNDKCLKILCSYLQQEHLDKKRSEFDVSGWELHNVKKIPQQMNGSDCGMFSCTFAEFLARDARISFTQEDMPYLRRKMVVEILEGRLLIS